MVVLCVLAVAVTLWVNRQDCVNSQHVGEAPLTGHSGPCELLVSGFHSRGSERTEMSRNLATSTQWLEMRPTHSGSRTLLRLQLGLHHTAIAAGMGKG